MVELNSEFSVVAGRLMRVTKAARILMLDVRSAENEEIITYVRKSLMISDLNAR